MALGQLINSATPFQWLQSFHSNPLITVPLISLGVWTLAKYPISLIKLLLTFTPMAQPFKISLSSLKKNRNQNDGQGPPAWVVITGPTSGIGYEFAIQFAQLGFSILLVGRNPKKLDSVQQDIHQNYPKVLVEKHVIDLCNPSESDWSAFSDTLNRITQQSSLSIIINNAGLSHSCPVPFELTPLEELTSIPAVNIIAPLRITQIGLPHMLKHRKGLIINVGSLSALVPTGLLSTYAGSKGFLATWSQALGIELESKGIDVRLLNTYFVASEMSKIRKATFMIPSSKDYVKGVIKRIGLAGGSDGKEFISNSSQLSHSLIEWVIDRTGTQKIWLNVILNMQKNIIKLVEKKKLRQLKAQKGQ
ncbi:hypothetical protein O181_046535 [Austropuccinia psidii MF-1]|uniref:Very-long-chain 3-oxoacyl-CoA reductase n=1 Tax=Austropuccinia psidii MF-1 TaxID=1389203 RepID=A0A9Q3DNP5_9BASI|nr:hypothetical protein [Austropuccinia psidii MF-1]